LLDDRSWQPVARDCGTVFFRVDDGSVVDGRFHPGAASSFVLPLSKEEDKRHARAVIKHIKETPEKPLPEDPGVSVMAAVAWGGDGINRNHLLPGKPPWPWHVVGFLGFPQGAKTGPRVEGRVDTPERVAPSTDIVGSESNVDVYFITDELGPPLCLSVSSAPEVLRFQWTDLSTNEAYVGTNWVYTLEMREPQSGSWVPVPGGVWPTRETEWMQARVQEMAMRFHRLRAELLEE
jgi:hypothetical protein